MSAENKNGSVPEDLSKASPGFYERYSAPEIIAQQKRYEGLVRHDKVMDTLRAIALVIGTVGFLLLVGTLFDVPPSSALFLILVGTAGAWQLFKRQGRQ